MTNLPWVSLCGSAIFSLGSQAVFVTLVRSAILGGNLLANYSVLITYEKFITYGLVFAVPISSGHYHSMTGYYLTYHLSAFEAQNGVSFTGMKLAGIIITCCGFILVLTPSNWEDYIRNIVK